jgi:hypothetical protein
MRDGEADDVLDDMSLNLARHNLEVSLKMVKEKCFHAAKQIALEGLKEARQMDEFVRKSYADEPRKMAEWEEVMRRYEFAEEEDEDE